MSSNELLTSPKSPDAAGARNVGTRLVRTNATHAARAVSDAPADAGIPVRGISASHQDGRLVVTVASTVREQVRAAVAGFALTVTTLP
ncbi:MAG TPA: hypothetical protein VGP91_18865 [Actinoplanes sp.]|jgi:hypothetical protein|nr:hypothetical protein [Actinoplanes sp.]